jgi:hypothetical protein
MSSERFEIGEVAIMIRAVFMGVRRPEVDGHEVTIAGPLELVRARDSEGNIVGRIEAYRIEPFILDGNVIEWVDRRCLRKKRPPAFDRECYRVTSWDNGVWRPKSLEVLHAA